MQRITATALENLVGDSYGAWCCVPRQCDGSVVRYRMMATCVEGNHRIWVVNEQAGLAWPVARPRIEGNLVCDLGLEDHIARDQRYSALWVRWVRAMFLPCVLAHVPQCPASDRRRSLLRDRYLQLEEAVARMPSISTVGTFEDGGKVLVVESHPEGVRVVDDEGAVVVRMPFGAGRVLGVAVPCRVLEDERIDAIRDCVVRVLMAAAADGRGPWAGLDPAVSPSPGRRDPWSMTSVS